MAEHKTQALVISCIDFRARKPLAELLKNKMNIDSFDAIMLAGGAKNILDGGQNEEVVLNNINISLKLHDPDLIVLVNHEDCGAYGGSKKFASKKEEEKFHEQELDKAQEMLGKIIGHDKKIEKIFLKL